MRFLLHVRNARRLATALLSVSVAALALAACGSSKPSSSGESGGGGSASGSTSHASVTMAVADEASFITLPITIADQLGYYKQQGVDVKLESLKGGSQAAQAMVGGSADVAAIAMDTTIQLDAKKPNYLAFAALTRYYTGMLVAAPGNTSITSVKDLAGKTIGVTSPGSSSQRFVEYLLHKKGVDASKVKYVAIGAGATSIAALEHSKVDAGFLIEPAYTLLQKQNPGKQVTVLADTRTAQGDKDVFGTADYPSTVLTASKSWLNSNGDAARKLTKAIVLALQWIHSHSAAQIADKVPSSYYGGDKDSYVKALSGLIDSFSTDGAVPTDGAQTVYSILKSFVPAVAQAKLTATDTYTDAYLPSGS